MHLFTPEELRLEEWRVVAGYAGYEVSSLGRVRRASGRMLRGYVHRHTGYQRVSLYAGKRMQSAEVHVLVAAAFHGPRPTGMTVRHFPDREKTNCRASNLSYGTHAENTADRAIHGTNRRGESNGQSRLTAGAVALMRWLRIEHEACFHELSDWFGVHRSGVRKAVIGETWAHVAYGLPGEG